MRCTDCGCYLDKDDCACPKCDKVLRPEAAVADAGAAELPIAEATDKSNVDMNMLLSSAAGILAMLFGFLLVFDKMQSLMSLLGFWGGSQTNSVTSGFVEVSFVLLVQVLIVLIGLFLVQEAFLKKPKPKEFPLLFLAVGIFQSIYFILSRIFSGYALVKNSGYGPRDFLCLRYIFSFLTDDRFLFACLFFALFYCLKRQTTVFRNISALLLLVLSVVKIVIVYRAVKMSYSVTGAAAMGGGVTKTLLTELLGYLWLFLFLVVSFKKSETIIKSSNESMQKENQIT